MKNKVKKVFTKENIPLAIAIIFLASIVLPVLYACRYAIPSGDDFMINNGYIASNSDNLLLYLLQSVVNTYLGWQGTYLAAIIGGFPLLYLSGISAVKLFLLIVATAFFCAFLLFVKEGCQWMGVDESKRAVVSIAVASLMLLFLISSKFEDEIFYWYSGTSVYTIPLTVAFLAVACCMAYDRKKSKKILVTGSVLAFFAAGGALCCSALLCSMLLFIILYDFIVRKTKSKKIIIGIFALAGSLINSLAPGNFIRSSAVTNGGIHPIAILKPMLNHFSSTLYDDFQTGLLVIVLLFVFILACALCKESAFEFKYPGLVTLYAFFGIFITDFPVFLGYNANGYFPSRVAFTERTSMIIYFALCAAYWGGYCAKRKIFSLKKEHYFLAGVMIVISLSSIDIADWGSYKMIAHLAKGDYAAVYNSEINMLSQIEISDGGDVVVHYWEPVEGTWTNLKCIGLTCYLDKTSLMNEAVAKFYGVDSVYVVPAESGE